MILDWGKIWCQHAHSTVSLKGSPSQATKPPTLHVDGINRPTRATGYDTACLQRTVAQHADIHHANDGLPERRSDRAVRPTRAHLGVCGRPQHRRRRTYTAAMRRLATARAPRCAIATTPRRAPHCRCRPARRPRSRLSRVPCSCTACQYLRRNGKRRGHPQMTAGDVRPTAGRRGQSASARSLAAAVRLPVRRARGSPACICKKPHRHASSVSARRPTGVAGTRRVAGEVRREQHCSGANSARSLSARRRGRGGGQRTEMTGGA